MVQNACSILHAVGFETEGSNEGSPKVSNSPQFFMREGWCAEHGSQPHEKGFNFESGHHSSRLFVRSGLCVITPYLVVVSECVLRTVVRTLR